MRYTLSRIEMFITDCIVALWPPMQLLAIQAVFIEVEGIMNYEVNSIINLVSLTFLFFVFVIAEMIFGIYVVPVLVKYWRIRKQDGWARLYENKRN